MIKVAINGFGRIGRMTFRKLFGNNEVEVVALNDLSTPEMLAYLLKYDSIHGVFPNTVRSTEKSLTVDGREVAVYAERHPENLPWKELDIDVVLECTGIFESKDKAALHLKAGAKKVIISAPSDKEVKRLCTMLTISC